ncbi:MAG: sigma 54-dependent Fis family transcriptional regulator [Planctomycetes bacterium]|nr:sigma 54-dependent Fis family transcriptional regulator [Planctomycetota bacterium]
MTSPPSRLRLFIHGASTHRLVDLDRPRLLLGRAVECDIVVTDPSVSRRHVVLERRDAGEQLYFRHLSGTNPTKLDGEPQPEGILGPGQTLTVGMTLLELRRVPQEPVLAVRPGSGDSTVTIHRDANPEPDAPPAPDPRLAAFARRILAIGLHEGPSEAIASRALSGLLAVTGHRAGILARNSDGVLEVLAEQAEPGVRLTVPSEVLAGAEDLRARSVRDGGAPAGALLVVPLAGTGRGLLVLGQPLATSGPAAVDEASRRELAEGLGALVWAAVEASDERERQREELTRLKLARQETYGAIVGSERLAEVRRGLAAAARSREPVRLIGEAGTEREELARFLHHEAPDVAGPFVTCYVRLLPLSRVRELLLGPTDGSVIQAGTATCLTKVADGTMYLDQPEHLPFDLQVELAAQLRDARRGAQAPRLVVGHEGADAAEIDARLHPELAEAIRGTPLVVPPLRGHGAEILRLAGSLLDELGPAADGSPRRLGKGAEQALKAYSWPENVAELRRVVQTAAMRARSNVIEFAELVELSQHLGPASDWVPSLATVEQEHIRAVLEISGNVKRRAAAMLGISPTTLYEKLKAMGQVPPAAASPDDDEEDDVDDDDDEFEDEDEDFDDDEDDDDVADDEDDAEDDGDDDE